MQTKSEFRKKKKKKKKTLSHTKIIFVGIVYKNQIRPAINELNYSYQQGTLNV